MRVFKVQSLKHYNEEIVNMKCICFYYFLIKYFFFAYSISILCRDGQYKIQIFICRWFDMQNSHR